MLSFVVIQFILYLLSLSLVYFAKSVAGYMIVIVLHLLVSVIISWLFLRPRLKVIHYYLFSTLSFLGLLAIFANLDFVFGLFNRETSLTGRVQMWNILMENAFLRRPWIGHGFGAIWANEAFRSEVELAAKWSVFIADNGFIDILLHLGVIGLALFLCVWVQAWVRSFRYGVQKLTVFGFFPLIFMAFTFFGNISFSFFLEVEAFIWLILVAILFAFSENSRQAVDT